MGWISERAMRRGCSLNNSGPKRKGPLKRIVAKLGGDHDSNLFGKDYVLLECGHKANSYGGQRALCEKCRLGQPQDSMEEFGYDDSMKVPVADGYLKNFEPEEIKERNP